MAVARASVKNVGRSPVRALAEKVSNKVVWIKLTNKYCQCAIVETIKVRRARLGTHTTSPTDAATNNNNNAE